jgi:Uma2 family endonuclease
MAQEMLTPIAEPVARPISGEELAALGEVGPCELVEGSIVPMTPAGFEHGAIELTIGTVLRSFVRGRDLGRVMVGEVGIYTHRNPDTVRGADVLYISHERYARQQSRSFLDVAPDLVVEILSPDNTAAEMRQKLDEYFAIGVRLVWVVSPRRRSVVVYQSLTEQREYGDTEALTGGEVLPGFRVPVASLFDD